MKKLHTRATTDLIANSTGTHKAQYLTKKNHTSSVMPVLILALIHGIASAEGWYGSVQYDSKEKVYPDGTVTSKNYGQINGVTQVTLGKKIENNWYIEADLAAESVDYTSGTYSATKSLPTIESQYQIGIGKRFVITDSIFTPYIKLSTGTKNKLDTTYGTLPIQYYRYDLGTNLKIIEVVGLKLNWRHRQAFSDNVTVATGTTPSKYKTNETLLGFVYKVTPNDSITFAKSVERASESGNQSTDYNHTIIQYSKNF